MFSAETWGPRELWAAPERGVWRAGSGCGGVMDGGACAEAADVTPAASGPAPPLRSGLPNPAALLAPHLLRSAPGSRSPTQRPCTPLCPWAAGAGQVSVGGQPCGPQRRLLPGSVMTGVTYCGSPVTIETRRCWERCGRGWTGSPRFCPVDVDAAPLQVTAGRVHLAAQVGGHGPACPPVGSDPRLALCLLTPGDARWAWDPSLLAGGAPKGGCATLVPWSGAAPGPIHPHPLPHCPSQSLLPLGPQRELGHRPWYRT